MYIIQKITAVILTTLLSVCVTFLKEANIKYSIENIDNVISPQQILQLSANELIFVINSEVLLYKTTSKELEVITYRKPNEFVGINNGEILFCNFEHYSIDSPNQFSTKFSLYDSKHNPIKDFLFFETIRPIEIVDNKIIAITAVDFLQKHKYSIDIGSGEKEEIPLETSDEDTLVEDSIRNQNGLDIKQAKKIGENEYIIIDIFGNTYHYTQKEEKLVSNFLKNFISFLSTFIPSKSF